MMYENNVSKNMSHMGPRGIGPITQNCSKNPVVRPCMFPKSLGSLDPLGFVFLFLDVSAVVAHPVYNLHKNRIGESNIKQESSNCCQNAHQMCCCT